MSVLEVRNATKRFPGVVALDDASIRVDRNEVVGLIGENGAGKSTLLKVLTGIYRLDEGEVRVNDGVIELTSPRDAFDHGVAMVFQEQSVIGTLSVAENIFLGREGEFIKGGLIDRGRMNEAARVELAKVHLDIDPAIRTEELSFAQRQMVEIAKALSLDSRIEGDIVILLDEPTSVLEKREVDLLFEIIRDLKDRAAIVFISHRLDEVLAISDRIYVLRNGAVVHETPATDATVTELHGHMVGRSLHHEYYREQRQSGAGERCVLEVKGLGRTGAFEDVSFALREGEVLGIAGVVGSGREALARCLAGLLPPERGEILIDGQPARLDSPARAVGHGVGFVPSERKAEGIVTGMSVCENVTLASLADFVRNGFIRRGDERAATQGWIERLSIRTPSGRTPIASLSGGNQQKVVLAKWRVAGSRIVILDHPTRGIDVGAKEDVYELVRDMTGEGLCVLLLADTLEEVIGLSSRIIVMRDGRVSATFDSPPGGKPNQVDLVRAMV
ncbi:MAG: sugar ABC transporter ATP-binding protein [Geminicoccaceae bacterium]|nr:sugar ABC transporter ATP-binding protein [Geminicoccaceae bacterium]